MRNCTEEEDYCRFWKSSTPVILDHVRKRVALTNKKLGEFLRRSWCVRLPLDLARIGGHGSIGETEILNLSPSAEGSAMIC